MSRSAKTKTQSSSLAAFCSALKKADHFLLACHVLPEGDAIGSLLAMQSLLHRLGKKAVIVAEEAFPPRLANCHHPKAWYRYDDIAKHAPRFDTLLVTDCPKLERIGKVQKLIRPGMKIFNIDHHVSNLYFGDYNYVDAKASATGEAVADVFDRFKMKLTLEEAQNIYIAIATDTGSFRYSNTTAKTHELAARLIRKGIHLESVNEELYANYSLNKIYLYSYLLKKIRVAANDQIAWVTMTRQDVKRYGAEYEDSEGFIDFLKYIRSVKVAFFASELPAQNAIRVSFRSKGDYDVQKVATHLGGGGHTKSSGCLFEGLTLQKSVERVLERLHKDFRL